MNVLKDIFLPYIPFVIVLVTIAVNIVLIWKRSEWFTYIVANIGLSLIVTALGFSPIDIISKTFEYVVKIIGDMIKSLLPF